MKVLIGRGLSALSLVISVIGLFVVNGISIELAGIMVGAGGYALGVSGDDRVGRVVGIAAVILNVVSIIIGGLGVPEIYQFPPVPR